MLKETNDRNGFFEHETFHALKEALPEYLKPVVTLAYSTGWRNREGRTAYLKTELLEMMKDLHRK